MNAEEEATFYWTHENLLVLRHMLIVENNVLMTVLTSCTLPVAARLRILIERNKAELEWIEPTIRMLDDRLKRVTN
jgi:hypothetical protein